MKAIARVTVTLDIPASGHWGADCTVAQVIKQAKRDVEDEVRRLVYRSGLKVRIVSTKVHATLVDEEK